MAVKTNEAEQEGQGWSRESALRKYLGGKVGGKAFNTAYILDKQERVKDDLGVLILVTKVMGVLQEEANGLGKRGPFELCTG